MPSESTVGVYIDMLSWLSKIISEITRAQLHESDLLHIIFNKIVSKSKLLRIQSPII